MNVKYDIVTQKVLIFEFLLLFACVFTVFVLLYHGGRQWVGCAWIS